MIPTALDHAAHLVDGGHGDTGIFARLLLVLASVKAVHLGLACYTRAGLTYLGIPAEFVTPRGPRRPGA